MRLKFKAILILSLLTNYLSHAQEAPPEPVDDLNWVSSISYSIDGQTLSKSVGFYNTLGKPTQSQSWDVLSGKVWGNQTIYDFNGKPALNTLSAPINDSSVFGIDNQFILDAYGNEYNSADLSVLIYSWEPSSVDPLSKLGKYYWDNQDEDYQDNTEYPFSLIKYSKLSPGSVKKVLGGNKINGEWLQTYSFSMPAGQELSTSRAFGDDASEYDYMRIIKTINRDVHGVETVVFTDSDGNTLAAARSGNEEQSISPVYTTLTIKEQGYVDIHIPKGCTGITVTNPDNIELNILNLTLESNVAYTFSNYTLSPGFYRVAARYPENYIYNEQNPIEIRHSVNYYDYSLNHFDISGRLLKSEQPNSYNVSLFNSTYSYNSLGQLQTTTSPDEGTAKFIYRKDGQIRFSQNTKQQENDEFSYTNYDRLGRPIESGVYRSDDTPFYLTQEVEDVPDPLPSIPEVITPIHMHNVDSINSSFGYTYKKMNVADEWNGGFYSGEELQENGYLSFKPFDIGSNNTIIGEYDVIVGFTEQDDAEPAAYTNIKYGINLHNDFNGNNMVVRIYQNGDFIRDVNNQKINFGTFSHGDIFKIERIDGIVTYLKNDQVFHSIADNFLQPLVVDTSFRYAHNSINNLLLYNEPIIPPASTDIDIQGLVNIQDGLNDKYCYEQNFTLYDIADSRLQELLKKCGLPSKIYLQTFLSGNVSKTYTNNPKTSTTWYSYDVYGRVKFMIQNVEGLQCLKTIDYTYDAITGQVTEVDYQRHIPDERFIHKYDYNIGGQLVKVSTSLDNVTYNEQAEYAYNETGQLERTELAENLQGIDYVYNLSGQLKAINHPSLNSADDPGNDGNNGFVADVFGLNIDYYNGDYRRSNTPTPIETTSSLASADQFNGNIKALEWQTQSGQSSTYAYHYNKNNWLTQADFSNPTISNSNDYKVSNIAYDANGNIKTLVRNGFTGTNGGTNAMDDFTYNYNIGKNQLNHINDVNDNTDPNRYNDLRTQETNNYIYNSIGQLVLNEQDKTIYEYSASGLVTKINEISNTNTNTYHTLFFQDYENVFRNDGLLWSITTGFRRTVKAHQADQNDVYGDSGELIPIGADLEDIALPEYCIDFDQASNPYESRGQFNFFQSNQSSPNPYTIQTSFTTIKDAYHKLEFDLFIYQKQIRRPSLGSTTPNVVSINADATITLKQEDGTMINSIFIDSQNYTQEYCDRIIDHLLFDFNATGNKVLLTIDIDNDGTLGQLSVQDMEELYQSAEVDNIHLQVANAPKVAFYYNDRGQRVRKEVYQSGTHYSDVTYYVRDANGSPLAIYNRPPGRPGPNAHIPKEHPVYGASRLGIYYRDGKKGTYAYQLSDHLGNVRAVVLKSGTNALSLTSKTDYYPFGMPMPNRNVEGDYRYGYQGEFAEKDPETGLNAFELRLWDSRIGRWLSPDPMGQYSSPYMGMDNRPVSSVDPTGGCTHGGGCNCDGTSNLPPGATPLIGEGGFINDTGFAMQSLDEVVINAPTSASNANAIPLMFAIETAGAGAAGLSLTAVGALASPIMLHGDTYDPYTEDFLRYGMVAGTFPWQHADSYDIVNDIYSRDNSSGYYLHYTSLPSAYSIWRSKTILANSSNQVYLTNALMAPVEAFTILFQAQETHKGRGDAVIIMKLHNYQEAGLFSTGDVFELQHQGNLKPAKIIYSGPNPFGGGGSN